mmetsp:Transcript_14362/g.35030  ORF Transcript_14362/g.35030 Transcript_14362/m.35030 type:complete len:253 (-) Transcript_14362:390-1148(-)
MSLEENSNLRRRNTAMFSPLLTSHIRTEPSNAAVIARPLYSATRTTRSLCPTQSFVRMHRPPIHRHSVHTASLNAPRQSQAATTTTAAAAAEVMPAVSSAVPALHNPTVLLLAASRAVAALIRLRIRADSTDVSLLPKCTTNILRQKFWDVATRFHPWQAAVALRADRNPAPNKIRSTHSSGRSPHGMSLSIPSPALALRVLEALDAFAAAVTSCTSVNAPPIALSAFPPRCAMFTSSPSLPGNTGDCSGSA